MHSGYLITESFDFKTITKDMVRCGCLVSLPFRLRLGELYRQNFQFRGGDFEIVLKNKFRVPEGMEILQVIKAAKNFETLYTEAIIVVRNLNIKREALERLREWTPEKSDLPPGAADAPYYKAMGALNHFISAYSLATKDILGPRLFNIPDFFNNLKYTLAIYCHPNEEITNNDYNEAFDFPRREINCKQVNFGELQDFTIEKARESISEYLKKQEDFVHYELAFEAKTKMLAMDYIGALLLAVAALEGAHAAFVQYELGYRLPAEIKASPEDFIKELGMSLCNQFTPFILLNEEERPDKELIMKAGQGLKYRNEIMHSLRNKKGQYRIITRTNSEISEAYSAILSVYDCYIRALEKRLKKEHFN